MRPIMQRILPCVTDPLGFVIHPQTIWASHSTGIVFSESRWSSVFKKHPSTFSLRPQDYKISALVHLFRSKTTLPTMSEINLFGNLKGTILTPFPKAGAAKTTSGILLSDSQLPQLEAWNLNLCQNHLHIKASCWIYLCLTSFPNQCPLTSWRHEVEPVIFEAIQDRSRICRQHYLTLFSP